MTYLTSQGFQKPTLAEIRAQREAFVLSLPAYGPGTDLSAEGPLGQLIAADSLRESYQWDGVQELVTSRDPDGATGVSADELFSEMGVLRLPATPATCSDVVLWATPGVSLTIPQGSQIKSASLPIPVFTSQSDVVFPTSLTGPFRGVRLKVAGALVAGNILSVQLDGTTYTYTMLITDTKASAIAALATLISSGAFAAVGAAQYESRSNSDYLKVEGQGFTLGTFAAYFALSQVAQSGIFSSTTVGKLSVPSLSLDTILTPVTDWLAVDQPAAAVAGTDVETDSAYRIRARQGQRTGTATDEAVTQALYTVSGVTMAKVTSNRTKSTDSEGRPPSSFEAVVSGGSNTEVGSMIALKMASGIEPWGTVYPSPGERFTVPSGRTYVVNFSRPAPVYAWVSVAIVSYDPDGGLPADYAAAIQDAVATYGAANFGLGDNFTLQKMYAAVYAVPGLYSVTIQIAVTPTESGTPTYAAANIAVDARHFLSFDGSRVVVAG